MRRQHELTRFCVRFFLFRVKFSYFKLGVGKDGIRSVWRTSCYAWITQMMTKKKVEKQKLLKQLIENSKSEEDKLIAARAVANQDSQKAANVIKTLMNKKWQQNRNTY